MPDRTDDIDPGLATRLSDYVSALPAADPPEPGLHPRGSRRRWVLALATGTAAVAAGAVLGFVLLDGPRSDVADASPTPTPDRTSPSESAASATPQSRPAEPSASASAAAIARPTPSAAPARPTSAPRGDWALLPIRLDPSPNNLESIADARGRVYLLGSGPGNQPAIWFSDDLESWESASVPSAGTADEGFALGGSIRALVDTGDRLVALAAIGAAEGSGYFGAIIYTSLDGIEWSVALHTGSDGIALFDLAVSGPRVLAVGRGIWVSEDGGATWSRSATSEDLGGSMRSVSSQGDVVLAAGELDGGDLGGPPGLVWVSNDAGLSWQRSELGYGAYETLIADDWSFLVGGSADEARRQVLWQSTDGLTWNETDAGSCDCNTSIIQSPTGVVAVSSDGMSVAASGDSTSWTTEAAPFPLISLAWTQAFGLIGFGDDGLILFPHPYP